MKERTCPVTTQESSLVHAPHEVVADVFSGLAISHSGDLGGIVRPQAPITDVHHVETTFTKEQLPYIKTVTGLLNGIAKGRQASPPYAAQIVARYTSYDGDDRGEHYAKALTDSSLLLLHTFSLTFPNLIPALQGMFEVAGSEGMRATLMRSRVHLYRVNESIRSGVAPFSRIDNEVSRSEFIQTHDDTAPSFEVRCASEILGRTLMEQSKNAALTIATTHLKGRYIPFPVRIDSPVYDSLFREFVRGLSNEEVLTQPRQDSVNAE